ncbi:hypothetical protein ACIQB4_18245 [Streptomyces griseoluteus]|uniref:hypothetical protein n=1 Tax=Streptomyces griseoluteus TaxID=29306 RepID=UPI0038054B1D
MPAAEPQDELAGQWVFQKLGEHAHRFALSVRHTEFNRQAIIPLASGLACVSMRTCLLAVKRSETTDRSHDTVFLAAVFRGVKVISAAPFPAQTTVSW